MSLLLDALKKAAERKAENSKETEAERKSSDDTVLIDQTNTIVASESETTSRQARSDNSQFDETELDRTQYNETEFEKEGDDETPIFPYDDETLVYADDDRTDSLGDNTLLGQRRDEVIERPSLDETELEKDEGDEHIVVTNEPITGDSDEDQTLIFTDDDVSAFLGGDDTVLRRELDAETGSSRSDSEPEFAEAGSGELDDSVDEELSISLFDEDDTLTAAQAARQAGDAESEEIELELAPLNDITKSLNLAAVPDKDDSEVEIGQSSLAIDDNPTPATGFRTETGLDTSTRTFAADNYDRTLRKPGSSDISSLFAGARSDTDVVMTPEYAKKMFRSKTSAQRIHNVKIYIGTALSILVVIVAIGILQLEQDTNSIENRLRALKRDPMPGLIKNTSASDKFTDVFAVTPGSEVDATTLLLVKNAESLVDAEEVVAVKLATDEETPLEDATDEQADSKIAAVVEDQTLSSKTARGVSKINTKSATAKDNSPATSNTINIISGSKISEKDRLLREAYDAYQRGDDKQALAKYNTALDLDPGNRNALLARAAIYIQNNRIPEAIRDYQTLLIAYPKDSLAMSSMIAVANFSPEQSETQLKLMIRDEPNSPYLNFALGNIFGAQNRWQEAQGQYFAALQNNPNDPNYAYNLAISLEHIAKPKVAIAYYEKALNNYGNGLATFNRDIVDARLEILKQL